MSETTNGAREYATVLVQLLDVETQAFGLTMEAGNWRWSTTDEWHVSKLDVAAEIAGAALCNAGFPLTIALELPAGLEHEPGRALAHALLRGFERGYHKMQDQ